MKERPILFSGPMVRAILAGRKTQTRRVVLDDWKPGIERTWLAQVKERAAEVCPYGLPGDRLWVRETWRVASESNNYPSDTKRIYIEWKAGWVMGASQQRDTFSVERDEALSAQAWGKGRSGSWRPSIHMPRWASRITLEVTGVRVERLQDIGEGDAQAEGVEQLFTGEQMLKHPELSGSKGFRNYLWHGLPGVTGPQIESWPWQYSDYVYARDSFSSLWESINGKRAPWASNPWVWVLDFKRVQP